MHQTSIKKPHTHASYPLFACVIK